MPRGLEDILVFRPCYHLKLKCGQIRSWMLGNSMEQAGWSRMNSKESCFFEEICFYQLWFYDMHSWADGLPAGPAVFHSFGVGGVGHANSLVSYTHGRCYAMHASFSACTHGGCYAMHAMQSQCTCPSEPAHMVDATQRVLPKKHVSTIYRDGNHAWKNECSRLGLKHERVSHGKMLFVVRDKKPLKSQAHLKGTQCIDRFEQALKKYLPSEISSKDGSTGGVNVRLLGYVHSFQFRFSNKQLWKSTGQACKESWKYWQTGDFVAEAYFGNFTILRQNNVGLQFPM